MKTTDLPSVLRRRRCGLFAAAHSERLGEFRPSPTICYSAVRTSVTVGVPCHHGGSVFPVTWHIRHRGGSSPDLEAVRNNPVSAGNEWCADHLYLTRKRRFMAWLECGWVGLGILAGLRHRLVSRSRRSDNTSVSVTFTNQGTNIGHDTVTCTSSSGGAPIVVTATGSPVTVGPFLNPGGVSSDVIVCSVTETFAAGVQKHADRRCDIQLGEHQSHVGERACSASNVTAPVVLSSAPGEKSADNQLEAGNSGIRPVATSDRLSLLAGSGSGRSSFWGDTVRPRSSAA